MVREMEREKNMIKVILKGNEYYENGEIWF